VKLYSNNSAPSRQPSWTTDQALASNSYLGHFSSPTTPPKHNNTATSVTIDNTASCGDVSISNSTISNCIRLALFLSVVLTAVFSIRSSAKLELWPSPDDAVAPLVQGDTPPLVLDHNNYIGLWVVLPLWIFFRATTAPAIHSARQSRTSSVCQTSGCWKGLAESLGLVRTFPDRHDQAWLVYDKSKDILFDVPNNRTYSDAGIIYVKTFKAASTTGAGVALRLSFRLDSSSKNKNGTSSSRRPWVRSYHTPGYTRIATGTRPGRFYSRRCEIRPAGPCRGPFTQRSPFGGSIRTTTNVL
jgi:hypothetical protein